MTNKKRSTTPYPCTDDERTDPSIMFVSNPCSTTEDGNCSVVSEEADRRDTVICPMVSCLD